MLPLLILLAGLALAPLPAGAADWVPPRNEPVGGPIVSFMHSNAGWQATVSLPDPAVAIAWGMSEDGPWQDTGLLDTIDPRTRRRMPNPSFPLDPATPATTLFIRYMSASGSAMGPFAIAFDPLTELIRSERQILEMLPGDWVSFRNFNGVLLYYTTLVSYRCAIQEARIGIDTPTPGKPVTLPPCDIKDPNSIPGNFQPYLHVPSNTRSASVEILFRDGTRSPVKLFSR